MLRRAKRPYFTVALTEIVEIAKGNKGDETTAPVKQKKKCVLTQVDFMARAKPMQLVLNGILLTAMPKVFSTGSYGWNFNQKTVIDVDGVGIEVQIGANITAVGSKPEKA